MLEAVLPAEPASARAARRFVVDALLRLRWDAAAQVAELLVSELVANAVLHAHSPVRVRVGVDEGTARVEVHDRSQHPAARRDHSPESTTGRGLRLVAELADRWGAEPVRGGKVVWFELEGPLESGL